jgi:hypothetical protein
MAVFMSYCPQSWGSRVIYKAHDTQYMFEGQIQQSIGLQQRETSGAKCNNPKFWKIEINGFIKIPNFGANKNFYFEYKINLLSFKTCEFEHLLPRFK